MVLRGATGLVILGLLFLVYLATVVTGGELPPGVHAVFWLSIGVSILLTWGNIAAQRSAKEATGAVLGCLMLPLALARALMSRDAVPATRDVPRTPDPSAAAAVESVFNRLSTYVAGCISEPDSKRGTVLRAECRVSTPDAEAALAMLRSRLKDFPDWVAEHAEITVIRRFGSFLHLELCYPDERQIEEGEPSIDSPRGSQTAESTVTWKTEHLPRGVLRIAFAGKGGIGSEGNDDGMRMREAVQEVLSAHKPRALLIDLRAFDYEFGDWIGGAPLKALQTLGQGCACVLASGDTMAALLPFWEATGFDQLVPLVEDRDEALRYLGGFERTDG